MIQCIKKTLLFFSCFAWTQQLLSLSTLSLWHNINKKTTLKRKNTQYLAQSTPNNKKPKQAGAYQCANCKILFISQKSLERHLSKKFCQTHFTCTTFPCEGKKIFNSKKDFRQHIIEYKTQHIFQCDFNDCNIIVPDEFALARHKKNHLPLENIVCDICFNPYKSLKGVNKHKKNKHNPDHLFICQICTFTYPNEDLLLKHKKIHFKTDTNKFSCLLCISDQSYGSPYDLNKHTKKHHAYYICKNKDCNESFILGLLLHQHMEKEHGFSSLPCSECSQSFHGLLTLYQHRYIEHKKCDKNTFIKFLKDFIEKNLRAFYPFSLEHPFFNDLFLKGEVLRDSLLSNLEKISNAAISIETLPLYEEFIKNITSENSQLLKKLSLDVLFSYNCYGFYFSHDSAIGLLFLKEILSIMIENRKPFETTYKEMLEILYRNQFSDQAYLLCVSQLKKIFFKKFSSSGALQAHEKDGLRTERSVIDKTLEDPNISLQESINTIGSHPEATSEYDLKNIENDLNNFNDFHQGKSFSFEDNDELPTHSNVKRYA